MGIRSTLSPHTAEQNQAIFQKKKLLLSSSLLVIIERSRHNNATTSRHTTTESRKKSTTDNIATSMILKITKNLVLLVDHVDLGPTV